MRRPRKPTPLSIIDLNYNPRSGRYEITERGITYHMDMEHTRNLKEYFQGVAVRGYGANVSDWYNKLDKITKKEIIRTGNIPTTNDFYHDKVSEDF
jgi:hypothetical protein